MCRYLSCCLKITLLSSAMFLFAFPPSSQVALAIKNLPAKAGDIKRPGVRSPGGEDPLEEGMATHSSILAWRIPWPEEPGGLQSMVLHESLHDLVSKQQHCPIN